MMCDKLESLLETDPQSLVDMFNEHPEFWGGEEDD
jgi:hypothetical protein